MRFFRDLSFPAESSVLEVTRGHSEPGGDLENLSFGINEVLFSYHLPPLNGNEGRLHLRPRSGLPIVEELQKGDRKGSAFSKKWQERYIFVMLHGHSYHWNFIGRSRG